MASLIKNISTPISTTEKKQIDAMMNYTKEEQVVKILSYYHDLNTSIIDQLISRMFNNIKKIFQHLRTLKRTLILNVNFPRPAFIIAIVIFSAIIVGSYIGIHYYQTRYQLHEAEKLLKDNHKIFIENVRLSGGFHAKGTSYILDGDSQKLSYLEQAKHRLNIAIENNAKSNEAIHLLAQTHIIENKFDKAEEMLMKLLAQNQSASILNDLGTIYYSRGDFTKAAQYFENTIQIDANFVEAHYNLALAKIKLGALEEAISFLNKTTDFGRCTTSLATTGLLKLKASLIEIASPSVFVGLTNISLIFNIAIISPVFV